MYVRTSLPSSCTCTQVWKKNLQNNQQRLKLTHKDSSRVFASVICKNHYERLLSITVVRTTGPRGNGSYFHLENYSCPALRGPSQHVCNWKENIHLFYFIHSLLHVLHLLIPSFQLSSKIRRFDQKFNISFPLKSRLRLEASSQECPRKEQSVKPGKQSVVQLCCALLLSAKKKERETKTEREE